MKSESKDCFGGFFPPSSHRSSIGPCALGEAGLSTNSPGAPEKSQRVCAGHSLTNVTIPAVVCVLALPVKRKGRAHSTSRDPVLSQCWRLLVVFFTLVEISLVFL